MQKTIELGNTETLKKSCAALVSILSKSRHRDVMARVKSFLTLDDGGIT
jgi:hypothetical protein